ncbi:MAG TPA: ribosome biogenesis GTP-binding protein YihA/YsxC [Xanthobacteraceae bacterium]|nr:ribosome biogenesis GTP-binding protein YihA/YsxC [Xanthobacteraceae bacterium]
MPETFTRNELEAGRRLFADGWQFVRGAASVGSLPPPGGIEIALAGRSNVGKSSLFNALTGRQALARVSNTPGRTQEINFFKGAGELVIADLPGYGYAEAPHQKVKAWTALIHDYLAGRANLARVFVLVDSRHGLKPADREFLDLLDRAAVSYAIVLTKTDHLKPSEETARAEEMAAAINKRPAAFPTVFPTSAKETSGIEALRAAIARLIAERKERG